MSTRVIGADLAAGTPVRVPLAGPPLVRPLRAIWAAETRLPGSEFLAVAHGTV